MPRRSTSPEKRGGLFGEAFEDDGIFLVRIERRSRSTTYFDPFNAATGLRLVTMADSIRPIDADLIPSSPAMAPDGA